MIDPNLTHTHPLTSNDTSTYQKSLLCDFNNRLENSTSLPRHPKGREAIDYDPLIRLTPLIERIQIQSLNPEQLECIDFAELRRFATESIGRWVLQVMVANRFSHRQPPRLYGVSTGCNEPGEAVRSWGQIWWEDRFLVLVRLKVVLRISAVKE